MLKMELNFIVKVYLEMKNRINICKFKFKLNKIINKIEHQIKLKLKND